MISEEYRGAQQWGRNKQAIFTVIWISFLSAAVATMVFFAVFDPVELGGLVDDDLAFSPDAGYAGYAAGFFLFWLLCALCSGLTAFLVRTAPKRDAKHRRK